MKAIFIILFYLALSNTANSLEPASTSYDMLRYFHHKNVTAVNGQHSYLIKSYSKTGEYESTVKLTHLKVDDETIRISGQLIALANITGNLNSTEKTQSTVHISDSSIISSSKELTTTVPRYLAINQSFSYTSDGQSTTCTLKDHFDIFNIRRFIPQTIPATSVHRDVVQLYCESSIQIPRSSIIKHVTYTQFFAKDIGEVLQSFPDNGYGSFIVPQR